MTTEYLEQSLNQAIVKLKTELKTPVHEARIDTLHPFDMLFYYMFGKYPNVLILDYYNINIHQYQHTKYTYDEFGNTIEKINIFDSKQKSSTHNTHVNIENYLIENKIPYIKHNIVEDTVFYIQDIIIYENYLFTKENVYPQWIIDCMEYITEKEEELRYNYVMQSPTGFVTTSLAISKEKNKFSPENYNDDLPDDKIRDFLNSDENGIVILYGEPGTGKTTYIRNLISTIPKKFVYVDSSVFNYITDASFIELLLSNRSAVIILEDCEEMLKDRKLGNSKIAALLNLADGILGDSLNLKFICTFNAKLQNIDPAILRKGRLKIKYEFKKLAKDKVMKLADDLNITNDLVKDMTLAELYNLYDEVEFQKKDSSTVGFKI